MLLTTFPFTLVGKRLRAGGEGHRLHTEAFRACCLHCPLSWSLQAYSSWNFPSPHCSVRREVPLDGFQPQVWTCWILPYEPLLPPVGSWENQLRRQPNRGDAGLAPCQLQQHPAPQSRAGEGQEGLSWPKHPCTSFSTHTCTSLFVFAHMAHGLWRGTGREWAEMSLAWKGVKNIPPLIFILHFHSYLNVFFITYFLL